MFYLSFVSLATSKGKCHYITIVQPNSFLRSAENKFP